MTGKQRMGAMAGILGLVVVLVCGWHYYDLKRLHTLTYGRCAVRFRYLQAVDSADMAYVAAQSELAICLCESYLKRKNPVDSGKIMSLYHQYGTPFNPDSSQKATYQRLDSIAKYRETIFDKIGYLD